MSFWYYTLGNKNCNHSKCVMYTLLNFLLVARKKICKDVIIEWHLNEVTRWKRVRYPGTILPRFSWMTFKHFVSSLSNGRSTTIRTQYIKYEWFFGDINLMKWMESGTIPACTNAMESIPTLLHACQEFSERNSRSYIRHIT